MTMKSISSGSSLPGKESETLITRDIQHGYKVNQANYFLSDVILSIHSKRNLFLFCQCVFLYQFTTQYTTNHV